MYFGADKLTWQSKLLESMFEDKLKAIETEGKKALINNDIEEAKWIKEKWSNVERFVQLAWELEMKKRVAIEDEDYDTAKIIKMELENVTWQLMAGN